MMSNRLKTKSGVELASMVDIVFLLVAFLIVHVNFKNLNEFRLNLPDTQSEATSRNDGIYIKIHKSGRVYINNQLIESNHSAEAIIKLKENKEKISGLISPDSKLTSESIFIAADKNVPYHYIVSVLDNLEANGIRDISLITEQIQ